jgi:glutamate-1-semialdehyde 2,1-aminomutase
MAAGIATLRELFRAGGFDAATRRTTMLADGLAAAARAAGIPIQVGHSGSMFGFYFLKHEDARITDYESAKMHTDTDRFARFFNAMLERGFYFAPSQFEAAFLSTAHTDADILATIDVAGNVFSKVAAR